MKNFLRITIAVWFLSVGLNAANQEQDKEKSKADQIADKVTDKALNKSDELIDRATDKFINKIF